MIARWPIFIGIVDETEDVLIPYGYNYQGGVHRS